MTTELKFEFDKYGCNLSNKFEKLLSCAEYSDVTLVCEDDKQFKQHKVILASCSESFRKMFKSDYHSIVYLRGVKSEHMSILLNFMYCGSAVLPESLVADVIQLGVDLQVIGLNHDEQGVCDLLLPSDPQLVPADQPNDVIPSHFLEQSSQNDNYEKENGVKEDKISDNSENS